MGKVRVFISWSGERSKHVAGALNDWIHDVIQNTHPFFSAEDIGAGSKWFDVIGKALEESDFAILCITKANARAPWVNFEAGACSKRFDKSRVVPYLIEGEKTDYQPPLTLFQCVKADEQGTFELIREINKAQEEPFDTHMIDRVFRNNWPHLQRSLAEIPPEASPPGPSRKPEEMFAEILSHLRDIGSKVTVARSKPTLSEALLSDRLERARHEGRELQNELRLVNSFIERLPEPTPDEFLARRAVLERRLKELTTTETVLTQRGGRTVQEFVADQFPGLFERLTTKDEAPEKS
jgi:hypothetical protein